jgi:alpha-beta hydrolase superfamily lysophospholipase
MMDDQELPFFFGPRRELFGMYHASGGHPRKSVLLCPPLGQDQIRCHRLYRQLAQALVADGVAVLRFDYYGTGDSAGSSADVDLSRCVADTVLAAHELRTRSGAGRVVAVGARLGANISLAAAAAAQISGVVAWDPILDGQAYVARLDAMQAALGMDAQRFSQPRMVSDVSAQWLGFNVSERLRHQLLELKIQASSVPLLLLDTTGQEIPAGGNARDAVVRSLQPPTPWDDLARLEMAILSHPLIQTVTGHVREAA